MARWFRVDLPTTKSISRLTWPSRTLYTVGSGNNTYEGVDMHSLFSRAFSVVLSLFLLALPASGNSGELLGVGKATGHAEINGLPFPGESNLYSGDRISTEAEATLTLFTTRQEKIHLAPKSRARLMKDGDSTVIALDQGTVAFRSAGATRAVIEKLGVEIRTQGEGPVIGQVKLFDPSRAQVSALRGALEVRTAERSVVLEAGQSAMIAATAHPDPAGMGSAAALTQDQKRLLWVFVPVAAAIATAVTIAVRDEAKPAVSPSVP